MEEVCLVIRAPNKKVEDFEVKCKLSWTLHKLKDHLLKNYPTKPVRLFFVHCFKSIIISHSRMPLLLLLFSLTQEIECQKLIYSGKLVVGDPVLRDILVTGVRM